LAAITRRILQALNAP